ncbi:SNF2 family N-terminal domain-containing protein [Nemania diffusa]|nr:SNF2 family N-terminal domain-containing protein [Nemania diffusa]
MFEQETLPIGHGQPPRMKLEPNHAYCAHCGLSGMSVGVGCEGCETTFYCSPECRSIDFARHRSQFCHPIRDPSIGLHSSSDADEYGHAPYQAINHNLAAPGADGYIHAPYQPIKQDVTAAAAAGYFIKNEPDQLSSYGPRCSDPYGDREREAIRNLLDVPEVDIPVWNREREPLALEKKLMPHQHVGLTWLINQEKSPHKGGILADDMGLGKTIQALSLILCRPPEDGTRKTTLIVVPTSLLRQWEREIDDKVKPGHKLKTIIFHSGKKRNMTVARLLSYDVVITTYGTLAHEWKQMYENRKSEGAMLLASHAIFHRIILDEAHNIKNRNSQASKAVDRLRGTYRLCMTGTPLMNRLDELYPLIRFLRIEPYREWENFRRNLTSIKGGETRAMRQLHVLLGRILLRRTEKTMVDGQPILTLPELTVQTVEGVFDQDQLDYYQALEQRSQLRMNKYLKEGTVTRNYWYILLLILRLRQCCDHPYLIRDHAIPEGVNMTPEEMTKLARKLPRRVVDRIKHQSDFECPMCHGTTRNPVIIYPCGHYVCGDCISNMVSIREPGMEAEGDEGGALMGQCPTDGCDGSNSEHDFTDDDSSVASGQKRKRSLGKGIAEPKKKSKKGKGQRTELTLGALKKSSLSSAAAKERYFRSLRKDWETSAKIDKAMELLAMIRRDFPSEKVLVFSQFTSFLDLMEIPISDDGYNYRRYDGSMPNGDRDAAVDDFMKKPEVKIMLVSLRCGNAGLNLYAATRVILLDPFWNPSVEDQAIKRAHRLGQTKPVTAYRILVKETVEDRILLLQEKKRQLVSDVLNPEARKGVSRLTVSELAGLFGINWAR